MKTVRTLVIALALIGCSGVHAACPDGGATEPSRLTARASCSWIGAIYRAASGEGTLNCPQVACPFPYDSSGRELWTCDPAAIEACSWALEGANDCATYEETMDTVCAEAALTCAP